MSASTPPPLPIPSATALTALLARPAVDNGGTILVPEPGTPDKKKRAISEINDDSGSSAPLADNPGGDLKSPAKKKTKVTEAEKEEKRKEKEARDAEKEEKRKERESKEEERRKEREAKEKEKAEKKAERDEKKRIKDEEKKKKDEEKAKKEKAQTRLNNFFMRPNGPKDPLAVSASTIEAIAEPTAKAASPEAEKKPRSDYERTFQPFFVKPNVTLAPQCPFERDDACKSIIRQSLDKALSESSGNTIGTSNSPPGVGKIAREEMADLLHVPHHSRTRRGRLLGYTTKDILARISAPDDSSLPPLCGIPENDPATKTATYYLKLLNSLPRKFLRFAEDVRPPYSGTYTRKPTTSSLLAGRNPFQKSLPNVNYDYDSEAEWEEGALDDEGEELMSDDGEEDDESTSAQEEMEDFLDDEDEEGVKRRGGAVSALVPICSGVCWEDEHGKNERREFEVMRMGVLLENVSGPIDPFSKAYWNPPPPLPPPPKHSNVLTAFLTSNPNMPPPRAPLAGPNPNRPPALLRTAEEKPLATTPTKPRTKTTIPAEDLEDFKRAVEGSDMTKAGLVEVLKKKFPKIGKEAIKATLSMVAARVGDREKDKRWVLI